MGVCCLLMRLWLSQGCGLGPQVGLLRLMVPRVGSGCCSPRERGMQVRGLISCAWASLAKQHAQGSLPACLTGTDGWC